MVGGLVGCGSTDLAQVTGLQPLFYLQMYVRVCVCVCDGFPGAADSCCVPPGLESFC